MNTWVFLQVRLGSHRLPQKALLPLGGKTMIEVAMESLQELPVQGRALVTDPESRSLLQPLAQRCGWEIFTGDSLNVLDRFYKAAEHFQADTIIRATGDNPLVSGPLALLSWENLIRTGADYSAHTGMPLGTGVEVIKFQALKKAWESQPDEYEREHVTPYLYRRPDTFQIFKEMAPEEYQGEARLTVDTWEDYQFMEGIFNQIYRGLPLTIQEVLACLKK